MFRYTLTLIISWLFFIMCALAAIAGKKYIITQNGKAGSVIIISSTASEAEHYAANTLQKYIEKISGTRLPILSEAKSGNEIFIGNKNDKFLKNNNVEITSSLKDEGFIIKTQENKLLLIGKDDWGTVYSVYSFLEKLGCRWFMPGPLGEVVPHKNTIEVGNINDVEGPSFKFRHVGEGDWSLANKCNNFLNVGGLKGYDQEFSAQNYAELVPTDKYFKSHPEYFAIHNGKRTADQLNLTNSDVLKIVVDYVDNFFAQHPGPLYPVFSVTPNDNSNFGNTKEDSLFGPTYTDQIMRFTNEVASEVGGKNPDKLVDVLAYQDYIEPPVAVKKMDSNVAITICRINQDGTYSFPITVNNYYSNRIRKIIERWVKIADHILFYDYYAHYEWYGPWPLEKTIAADFRYYHSLGPKVEGLVPEFHPHWGTQGINDYLMGKLAWNVNLNVDSLVNDYYQKFYGKDASAIKDYFNVFANRFNELNMPFWGQMSVWNKVYTPEVLRKAEGYLATAQRAVKDTTIKARIHLLELGLRYVKLRTEFQKYRDDSGNMGLALNYMNKIISFVKSLPQDEVFQTSDILHYLQGSQKFLLEDIARVDKYGAHVDSSASKVKLIFVKNWNIIGPFPNESINDLEKIYPPEKEIDLHKSYEGKDGKTVRWQFVKSPTNRINLEEIYPREEHAIAYAVSYVYSSSIRKAFVALGSDDGISAWVNGKKAGFDNANRTANAFQDAFPINLKKGWNAILLKITQDAGGWGFYASIVNKNVSSISDLKYTTDFHQY